ncbi:MAG: aldo/keto reductase [Sulfuricurvum sp. PC08-66]|nr:MAG: aldo/keto reductase [Sulfuricurvum sp. PC08-66]
MEYRYIGNSGLRVTPICLGTMGFGSWSDEKTAFAIMDAAVERGINFFDTAEVYPIPPKAHYANTTERIVGKWLKGKPRDSLILATKVAGAANGWFVPPIRHGLTAIDRFHIERAIEGSLERLGTDYIDLYQIHWPDSVVPIEESLEAMDRLVQAGKVRYIGTSNDTAYGLTKANETAKHHRYARFQSIQNNFSLLHRRALDEIATVCRKEKISLLPYSPIAGGVLSGKYNQPFVPEECRFAEYAKDTAPRQQAMRHRFLNDRTLESTARYIEIASRYGISPVTLAVAWSMDFDFVASTIIGARTVAQLEPIFAAFEFKMSDALRRECDAVHADILYPMG